MKGPEEEMHSSSAAPILLEVLPAWSQKLDKKNGEVSNRLFKSALCTMWRRQIKNNIRSCGKAEHGRVGSSTGPSICSHRLVVCTIVAMELGSLNGDVPVSHEV